MKNGRFILIILFFVFIRLDSFAQGNTSLFKDKIAVIEKRGQEIADYEKAAIKATDLLLASNPDKSKLSIYVAVKEPHLWRVYFGKVSNKGFKAGYVYSCPDGQFSRMTQEKNMDNISDEVIYLAKAVSLALDSLGTHRQFAKYNPDAFREKDGTITVYLMPGNEVADNMIIGGDFRLSISNDASRLLNKTKLHDSFIKFPLHKSNQEATMHTHILGLPTETDVALTILNPSIAPHCVVDEIGIWKIDTNGKISFVYSWNEGTR